MLESTGGEKENIEENKNNEEKAHSSFIKRTQKKSLELGSFNKQA